MDSLRRRSSLFKSKSMQQEKSKSRSASIGKGEEEEEKKRIRFFSPAKDFNEKTGLIMSTARAFPSENRIKFAFGNEIREYHTNLKA